jgi:acetyl-CoA acetyltransferase family protein
MNSPLNIIDGVRTPFCKFGTDLSRESAADLGAQALKQLLARTGIDPRRVDHVITGCVGQPAGDANLSRVIALRAGLPECIPAHTVHRNCASGLEAISQAQQLADSGAGEVFLVVATESMSQYPLHFSETTAMKFGKLSRARTPLDKLKAIMAFNMADFQPQAALRMGLTDPTTGLNMGDTADILARDFNITRKEQDLYSLFSHKKAVAAKSRLREEMFPYIPNSAGKKALLVKKDNGPREGQSRSALTKLKPVFDRKFGRVTAGNSSQITDGAVALLVMSEAAAKKAGKAALGRLLHSSYVGCQPARMGLGPVYAIDDAEKKTGLGLKDADLIEINEAFAAQVLAVAKASRSPEFCEMELNRRVPLGRIPGSRLNVNGGAIALGHPVGATGARLVLSTLKELHRRNASKALVSLCVGGGQGAALWLEARTKN